MKRKLQNKFLEVDLLLKGCDLVVCKLFEYFVLSI